MEPFSEIKKPNIIEELLTLIYKELGEDENFINIVKTLDAEQFSIQQHHGMGQYIRNEFIHKPTGLTEYGKSIGIHLPDDLSTLVLIELHKYSIAKINGTPYSYVYTKKVYPSMNKYALHGHKVKVTTNTLSNGTTEDANLIIEHINVEYKYTIDKTVVKKDSTEVYLTEREGIAFNSVNFEDITIQSKMSDTTHPDYQN